MLKPSPHCLDLIREFEGLQLKAYKCPAGVWTVGYGSTGPGITAGLIWTLDQAKDRLAKDVATFAAGVATIVRPDCTQGQFDALVSFAYNVGLGALKGSTLLKLHLAGERRAALEFARWNKAAGKVLAGLTRRREAEAALYRS